MKMKRRRMGVYTEERMRRRFMFAIGMDGGMEADSTHFTVGDSVRMQAHAELLPKAQNVVIRKVA